MDIGAAEQSEPICFIMETMATSTIPGVWTGELPKVSPQAPELPAPQTL